MPTNRPPNPKITDTAQDPVFCLCGIVDDNGITYAAILPAQTLT